MFESEFDEKIENPESYYDVSEEDIKDWAEHKTKIASSKKGMYSMGGGEDEPEQK